MKKNRLYTVNKWNKSAIGNVFDEGGLFEPQGYLAPSLGGTQFSSTSNLGINNINLTKPNTVPRVNWSNGVERAKAIGTSAGKLENFRKANGLSSVTSKPNVSGNVRLLPSIGAVGAAIGGTAGNLIRGDFDDGGIGSGIQNIGGQIGSAIPGPIGGIVSLGTGLIGGLFSRMFGVKENKENTNFIKQNTSNAINTGNVLASSSDNMSLVDNSSKMVGGSGFHWGDLYQNGWFTSKGTRLGNNLIAKENTALAIQNNGLATGADNIDTNMDRNALRNFAAYGGPLDFGGGALDYGLAMDYLTMKRRDTENKNKMAGLSPIPAFSQNTFAIGGDLQTNGADFSDGLVTIGAGGSHEENPYEGIQLGTDENGTPNLVEENETIFNDYVFSNRILADETTKQLFRLPKKKDITFADISKKLEKEIAERPNDPISKSGFEAQMQTLEEQQERQKQEMEAEKARAAFEALSPEEQTAVMQNAAQQEQMAQQAAQEQAIAEQQAMQQPSPEEMQIMQQQQMSPEEQAAMEQQQLAQQQANVSALGGQLVRAKDVQPVHKYAIGGRKAKRIARRYNQDWFNQMAKSLGISDEEMSGFVFNPNNPEANLTAFNRIYRDNQYNKARDTYRAGQRQSKRNELFGNNGLYRYSADKKHLYRGRVNDADRVGYINKDYTGDSDNDGNILGFMTAEDYNKKRTAYEAEKDGKKKAELLNELEGYKAINEKAGDYMHDFYGKRLETPETMSENEILQQYDTDYANGFKWDDNDAQTLQYPVDMEHSATSAMRYIPAIGGAVGLMHDIFSSPDYSRPQAIVDAAQNIASPALVTPHYIGNYLTYRPLDIWYGQNRIDANARATDRTLLNSNNPSRMAGLLASGYNSQLASGNLFRQAQEYNDAQREKVASFNRGTDSFNAEADMNSQRTNAMLGQEAGRAGMQGLITGYGMMDNIDARRNSSMNANLTNLLQSLGNIGEEAYDKDRLKWLERTGALKSKTLGANGGKLKKKKRGLTF